MTKDDNMTEYLLNNEIDLAQFNMHDLVALEFQNICNNSSSLFELSSVWPFQSSSQMDFLYATRVRSQPWQLLICDVFRILVPFVQF